MSIEIIYKGAKFFLRELNLTESEMRSVRAACKQAYHRSIQGTAFGELPKQLSDLAIETMIPHFSSGRDALINAALYGDPVLEKISYVGSARDFADHLMRVLSVVQLITLLESMSDNLGPNRQKEFQSLIDQIRPHA